MMTAREFRTIFAETRRRSEEICAHLQTEDYGVQPVEYVSPPKWHLGHTSWFFEELVLKKCPGYKVFDPRFGFIFNSYYESVGERVQRRDRGNLSRPTVARVLAYRAAVTEATLAVLEDWSGLSTAQKSILEIGVHHEQQHQELLWTDIKYILGHNPLAPSYTDALDENPPPAQQPAQWVEMPAGIYDIGHGDPERFCYDNERARHRVFLEDFTISNHLVQNQEYLAFIEDGGYAECLLWHAEGWQWRAQNGVNAPLYWQKVDGQWFQYTLGGLTKLQLDAPLSHVSFYEAAAFARWKGMRLPTEFEWEAAQAHLNWGSRWEWTESAYTPYPGFQKAAGALGEYNAKFMVNQKVLRGASVATPAAHQRPTYRNYFHPPMRWQFTGIRLAN